MKLNYRAWAIAVAAGVLVPGMIWAATKQFMPPSSSVIINCSSPGACSFSFAVGQGGSGSEQGQGLGVATPLDQTTNWTGGNFSGDLTVGGTLNPGGAVTQLGGALLSPLGDYATYHVSSTMAQATSTCAVQNLSGRTRTLLSVGIVVASSTSALDYGFVVGTSTSATVTSTSPLINTHLVAINGKDVINTTSTFMNASSSEAYAPWAKNEWLVWTANSTTQQGNCRALFY